MLSINYKKNFKLFRADHVSTHDESTSAEMVDGMQVDIILVEIPQTVLKYPLIRCGRDDFTETGIVPVLWARFRQETAFQPGDTSFFDDRNVQLGTGDRFNTEARKFVFHFSSRASDTVNRIDKMGGRNAKQRKHRFLQEVPVYRNPC